MAPPLDFGPNPFAVPDKDSLRLNDNTMQSSMPPITATPPAAGPGLNMAQLGAPTTTSQPGPLTGQTATPPAPAPLPTPPTTDAAPDPLPKSAQYTPPTPEEYLRQSKPYGDELRKRASELVPFFHPGPGASIEQQAQARVAAYSAAEKEMAPHFMQMIANGQYRGDQSYVNHEKADTAARTGAATVKLKGQQGDLAEARTLSEPQKLAISLGKLDVSQHNSLVNQAFKETIGGAATTTANSAVMGQLAVLRKQIADHPDDAGALTQVQQLAPGVFGKMMELAGMGSRAPDVQQGRGIAQQQGGLVNSMLATRTGGALPPLNGAPGSLPPAAGGQGGGVQYPPMSLHELPHIGPISAAPRPPPLPAAAGALDAPPQNDALRTLGSNILTARPGAGGPPQLLNQGGQDQASNRPGPVAGSLKAPANEGPIKDRIRKMFKGGDQLSDDILQQEAVAAIRLMDVTKNKPDKMPPSNKWLNSYKAVHGVPWEAPAQ